MDRAKTRAKEPQPRTHRPKLNVSPPIRRIYRTSPAAHFPQHIIASSRVFRTQRSRVPTSHRLSLPAKGGNPAARGISAQFSEFARSFTDPATHPAMTNRVRVSLLDDLLLCIHRRRPRRTIDDPQRMWLDAGVRLVLVAYPGAREVYAHHDGGSVVRYGVGDTLVGDPVLPASPARWAKSSHSGPAAIRPSASRPQTNRTGIPASPPPRRPPGCAPVPRRRRPASAAWTAAGGSWSASRPPA